MLPKTVNHSEGEGGKHVLLVDDSKTVLSIHSAILEEAGFRCRLAQGGSEALEILLTERFDLLVTDLNMPKMDGYELAKRVRKSEAKLPIMMVSTESERGDINRGIEAGVDVYLVKPIDPEEFIAKCRMLAG